ncbi:DUF6993 domain-containing protein [Microbacterium sp. A196]|uniref:DUF6993 domain-containing protein n=1 Tax=unclassified Microbacterium TaxID=2609290 RepID=UPI003FD6B7E6
MPRRPAHSRPYAVVAGVLISLGLALTACAPEPAPTPTPTAVSTATAEPTPEGPVFHPDGTAEDNLPIFEAVTAQVWAASGSSSGRAYIDALVAAGFDKSAMQVTQDLTTVGHAVESMQFSVRWGDAQCLVGQVGPSTGNPVTMVMDQLAEGRCLVGSTRPIDW